MIDLKALIAPAPEPRRGLDLSALASAPPVVPSGTASVRGSTVLDGLVAAGPGAVAGSEDLARILALPRRVQPVGTDLAGLVVEMTARLRRVSTTCRCADLGRPCITTLNPVQAAALWEASQTGGYLGLVGVGHGKTGLDILLPMVVPGCKRAVLFIPPNLRAQFFEQDYPAWSQHFRTPILAGATPPWTRDTPVLHVMAYSALSNEKQTAYLSEIDPDLVIADEVHNLKSLDSSRGMRVARFMDGHREARFCGHSGSITTRSPREFSHVSMWALKERSPVPLDPDTVVEWSSALEPSLRPAPMGELAALCRPGEHVRQAFRRRLVETLGVIATDEAAVGTSLIFDERRVAVPDEVKAIISATRNADERPDGEIFVEDLAKAKCLRELACGFYYRWCYPRGERISDIERWFAARKAWMKELRDQLRFHAAEHLDSPLLLSKAAKRWHDGYTWVDAEGAKHTVPARTHNGPLATWPADCWQEWVAVRDTVKPETETIWVSDFLAADAAAWARSTRGIVWYDQRAFGERVAAIGELPQFGGGDEASAAILQERGKRSIVASIDAHGTGKNLQHAFSRSLVANPPSNAGTWEQLVGRTHRIGQQADEVEVHYYAHTSEVRYAIEQAKAGAEYIEQTTGMRQKLCVGRWLPRAR